MRKKWNQDQKIEFWQTFVIHRDEGCNIKDAFRLATADLRAVGKSTPNWWTFKAWYRKAMTPPEEDSAAVASNEETQAEETAEDGADAAEPEIEPETETEAEDEPEAETEAEDEPEADGEDDPMIRMKLMLRLYRSHSEKDMDELCDYLLPRLFDDEP